MLREVSSSSTNSTQSPLIPPANEGLGSRITRKVGEVATAIFAAIRAAFTAIYNLLSRLVYAITPLQYKDLTEYTTEQLQALTTKQLLSLRPKQILALQPDQIRKLQLSVMSHSGIMSAPQREQTLLSILSSVLVLKEPGAGWVENRKPTALASDDRLKELVSQDFHRITTMEVIHNGKMHKIGRKGGNVIYDEVTGAAFAEKFGLTHNQALNALKFLTQCPGPLPLLPIVNAQVELFGAEGGPRILNESGNDRVYRLEITKDCIKTTFGATWNITKGNDPFNWTQCGTVTTHACYTFTKDALLGEAITADDDSKCEVQWTVADYSIA